MNAAVMVTDRLMPAAQWMRILWPCSYMNLSQLRHSANWRLGILCPSWNGICMYPPTQIRLTTDVIGTASNHFIMSPKSNRKGIPKFHRGEVSVIRVRKLGIVASTYLWDAN